MQCRVLCVEPYHTLHDTIQRSTNETINQEIVRLLIRHPNQKNQDPTLSAQLPWSTYVLYCISTGITCT